MSCPCPISGFRFAPFGSWHGVRHAVDGKVRLFYQAPLDTAPRPVIVLKVFKNGKLRVSGGETTFTTDAGHADRFFWLERVTP